MQSYYLFNIQIYIKFNIIYPKLYYKLINYSKILLLINECMKDNLLIKDGKKFPKGYIHSYENNPS